VKRSDCMKPRSMVSEADPSPTRGGSIPSSRALCGIRPGRHQANCKACQHVERAEIERAFVSWRGPAILPSNTDSQTRPTSTDTRTPLDYSKSAGLRQFCDPIRRRKSKLSYCRWRGGLRRRPCSASNRYASARRPREYSFPVLLEMLRTRSKTCHPVSIMLLIFCAAPASMPRMVRCRARLA
jgi:hypothetical protein